MVVKKPSDHCTIQIKITIPCIRTDNINFRNPEGWQNYKIISDIFAPKMKDLVENTEDIKDLRIRLHIVNLNIQIKSFDITWKGPGKKKRRKKR